MRRGRQIFGDAKDFWRNLRKLARKMCISKMMETFFQRSHKTHKKW